MPKLDRDVIKNAKKKIEQAIVPVMEDIYFKFPDGPADDFRPGLKLKEKIFSYYDYFACGISVLAVLASQDDDRAENLIRKIEDNTEYYIEKIYRTEVDGAVLDVPMRRLLFHMALAYDENRFILGQRQINWYEHLFERQVPAVIDHCGKFFPGEEELHLKPVNNHTAIFMQGLFYCGSIFDRREWTVTAHDFAKRYLESGHEDGYFEENTNELREGGPSLVYTRLTAGCLYDVLNGKRNKQEKFIKAGEFFRQFLNAEGEMIPLADERTNAGGKSGAYGLALHSLTPEGRGYILRTLEQMDFGKMSPENLAVLYHELDLIELGEAAEPEYLSDGCFRLQLPLGVIRKGGFTAGISALKGLNREINPNGDYALDQQNMVYLAHKDKGVILPGVKSKNNPEFSTFRVGDDAYTVKTGELDVSETGAQAKLFYKNFTAGLKWEIGETARLTLSADTEQTVITSLPFAGEPKLKTDAEYSVKDLDGFSPYTAGNKTGSTKAFIFEWQKELTIEFEV